MSWPTLADSLRPVAVRSGRTQSGPQPWWMCMLPVQLLIDRRERRGLTGAGRSVTTPVRGADRQSRRELPGIRRSTAGGCPRDVRDSSDELLAAA